MRLQKFVGNYQKCFKVMFDKTKEPINTGALRESILKESSGRILSRGSLSSERTDGLFSQSGYK